VKILVLDTETTGLDANARVIEIAAAIYETKTKCILWQFASLVPGEKQNGAEHINQIPVAALVETDGFYDPYEELNHYADLAEAVIAHNVAFDRRMLGAEFRSKTPWVCSQTQLVFPRAGRSKKLVHLAVDHGILAVGAHRALGDVLMLTALFRQTPDLEEQVKRLTGRL
jgi:DNA polymerase-3 subunit epsilon